MSNSGQPGSGRRWLRPGLEILGALATLVTLVIGVVEYRNAQKWQRSEFAAKQIERIHTDPQLFIAAQALEWRVREFRMPETLRPRTSDGYFKHNPGLFAEALKPEDQKRVFTDNEIFYLDTFDYFFDYLERVNHYLSIGLFDVTDIAPLCYRTRLIAHPQYVEKDTILKYLKFYDYDGVLALITRCEIPAP